MTATQQNLTNLLHYAEEILKIGERVISDLAKDAALTVHEQDVQGLDGVTVNGDDGSWVRFSRLREIPSPPADPMFDDWIVKPTSTRLFDRPRLVDSRMVKVSAESASDLVEAGLADPEDVMTPIGEGPPGQIDVLLRLTRLDEFASLFQAYVDGPWSDWAITEQPRRRSIAIYNRLYIVQQRMTALATTCRRNACSVSAWRGGSILSDGSISR
jgi:hypothetical protein